MKFLIRLPGGQDSNCSKPFGPSFKKPRRGQVPFGSNGRPGPGTGTTKIPSVTMAESEAEEDGSAGGSGDES